ncbi:MAG: TRAP transporter large permease subunit, partial [Burkholderiaceae bacterium]|nr:TRAP transporter large permease subunit [Burkholderiaceae bacterium]
MQNVCPIPLSQKPDYDLHGQSSWATPTESAALTAFYALIVVSVIRRELSWTALWSCFLLTAQLIGGVMLILGM